MRDAQYIYTSRIVVSQFEVKKWGHLYKFQCTGHNCLFKTMINRNKRLTSFPRFVCTRGLLIIYILFIHKKYYYKYKHYMCIYTVFDSNFKNEGKSS